MNFLKPSSTYQLNAVLQHTKLWYDWKEFKFGSIRRKIFCNMIMLGLTLTNHPKGLFSCQVDRIVLSHPPNSSDLELYNFYTLQNWRNTFANISWIQMKRWKRPLGLSWRKLICYGFMNIVHCWQNQVENGDDYVEKYCKYWQQESSFQGLFSCFIYSSIPI